MTKRAVIVLLVGLNLVLLAALILLNTSPPAAYAQAAPLGQNFAMVAGQIQRGVDGLYVLDLAQRRLHLFIPNRDQINRRALYVTYRDLQKDFRGGR
jgi:hypothetical protein